MPRIYGDRTHHGDILRSTEFEEEHLDLVSQPSHRVNETSRIGGLRDTFQMNHVRLFGEVFVHMQSTHRRANAP